MAGLQMEFEKDIDSTYKVFEVDGYKVAVHDDLIDKENYLELKYSDNFLVKDYYVSNKKLS